MGSPEFILLHQVTAKLKIFTVDCKAVGFQRYHRGGKSRWGQGKLRHHKARCFLPRLSQFYWMNVPWIITDHWLIFEFWRNWFLGGFPIVLIDFMKKFYAMDIFYIFVHVKRHKNDLTFSIICRTANKWLCGLYCKLISSRRHKELFYLTPFTCY